MIGVFTTQPRRRTGIAPLQCSWTCCAVLVAAFGAPAAFAQEAQDEQAPPARTTAEAGAPTTEAAVAAPGIDLAFCIDVSGSMSSGMDRAKRAVAAIVREVEASNPGTPLRLGLMRYGDGDRNYFVLPLTDDRSKFFSALGKTGIQPGSAEFFGAVIERAAEKLGWSEAAGATKLLYVVGNETAEQGHKNYREVVPKVVAKGISVSALYCPYLSLQTRQRQTRHGFSALGRNAADSSAAALGVVQAELDQKITWVDAARLGGGLFLQLNYRDGAEELPAFVWQPSDFAAVLEEMRSPQFLTRLTQDRALDQIDALLSDAIVQGWQQKARGAGSYSLARPGMFPGAALRPRGSGSGLVGGR